MLYSVPIIALTSQNLHWKAVPCHFNSTSILCKILTLRYLSIQASMMAHQKANCMSSATIFQAIGNTLVRKMKFSYRISVCVILVKLELESCPADSETCDFPHRSHYQCFYCSMEQNVTGTELAVCSCACRLSIPALQDEV